MTFAWATHASGAASARVAHGAVGVALMALRALCAPVRSALNISSVRHQMARVVAAFRCDVKVRTHFFRIWVSDSSFRVHVHVYPAGLDFRIRISLFGSGFQSGVRFTISILGF